MNDFLKELMKLATELNQANGFGAVVVIGEMESLYNKHITELIHSIDVKNSLMFPVCTAAKGECDRKLEDVCKECKGCPHFKLSTREEKITYWAKQLEGKPLSASELTENVNWLLNKLGN